MALALKLVLFTEMSVEVCMKQGDDLAIFSSFFLCHLGKGS